MAHEGHAVGPLESVRSERDLQGVTTLSSAAKALNVSMIKTPTRRYGDTDRHGVVERFFVRGCRIELSGYLAVSHHQDAIAVLQQFRQVFADDDRCHTLLGQYLNGLVHVVSFEPMSTPTVGP